MPLTEYEPFFPDDEHALMSSAFELAWQKLAASLRATKSDEEIQAFRAKLAECIIISALEVEEPENVSAIVAYRSRTLSRHSAEFRERYGD